MTDKWRVKLDCGHWSDPIAKADARDHEGLLLPCSTRDCGGALRACTDQVRRGGLTGAKTQALMDAGAARQAFAHANRVPHRFKDGLMVKRLKPTRVEWWCRFCDGSKPEYWLRGRTDITKLDAQWDQHKQGLSHQAREREQMLVERLVQAIDPNRKEPSSS